MQMPKNREFVIGIFIYDGVTMLDVAGPYQVLKEIPNAKVMFITPKVGVIRDSGNMPCFHAEYDLSMRDKMDLLLIPGGLKSTLEISENANVLEWIRYQDQFSIITASVCTGAWILAAAGLLNGRNAVTHWYGREILSKWGVNVKESRWINDGKYYSSAGVSAGIDMSLAIVGELIGREFAQSIMLDLEYAPEPPYDGGTPDKYPQNVIDDIRKLYDSVMK